MSTDQGTVTVRIPLAFARRGARKVIVIPAGAAPWVASRPQVDDVLLRALVQAFHWQGLLDEGEYATVSELAKAEKLNISFVAHTLRLTLLAPDLVEAILDGKQQRTMQLQPLIRQIAEKWDDQRASLRALMS